MVCRDILHFWWMFISLNANAEDIIISRSSSWLSSPLLVCFLVVCNVVCVYFYIAYADTVGPKCIFWLFIVEATFYKPGRTKVVIALQLSVIARLFLRLAFLTCCRHSHGESCIFAH
ncbi:hypothetical protein EDC96DRAFT_507923 [Choanephora cucurbitarum]|nr:hypothetical protein EDC96DRAFT_507923 [Choanephora cucurbitarum]